MRFLTCTVHSETNFIHTKTTVKSKLNKNKASAKKQSDPKDRKPSKRKLADVYLNKTKRIVKQKITHNEFYR